MKIESSIGERIETLRLASLLALCFLTVLLGGQSGAAVSYRDCTSCPVMVVVPAGTYEMGHTARDDHPETDADPPHTVRISRDFAVSAFEISRAEFKKFLDATSYMPKNECNIYKTESWILKKGANWRNPGYEQTADDPVVCISWIDTQKYVNWLSRETGHEYRLLSEAEWEYVAKVGSAAHEIDKISHDFANYGAVECCGPKKEGNDRWDHTAPVGSFPADSLGLFDIRGNVWEWLQDCYHESYDNAPSDGTARTDECSDPDSRAVRGGGWGDDIFYLRASYRLRAPKDNGYFTLGFRVARNID